MVETKRKVAAYCRVSTDNEDQANSFESQQRYFRQYIERNPDWELYEIFADEGISGTNTKKRKEFNRMIACAKNGDFDLIITKEISRFARNTLDSIYYTRELKKHGVGVIFMNDNINTLDGDAELRLAIMSSIAQEESRKTSERVKWGQKRQMEQGVVFGRSMLGYDVEGGKMTINEEGARVVRLIFHKFVNEGKGTHVIARELREEGISPMRVKEWSNTVILRVIRNEKYCGDLVQKKTYTPDFLSHEKKYNRGQEEFVIIKDHHEPIISRELFDEANRILDAKSLSQEGKAKHSNRYPFSGKIKCGCCGSSYVARYKTRKDGSRYKAWRCNEAAKHGSPHIDKAGNQVGCTGLSIRNEDATHIMYLVTKSLKYNRDKIINNLTAVIQSIIAMDTTGTNVLKLQEQIKKIEGKRANLIDLYMSNLINKDEFTATRASCDAEIEELQSIIESVDKQREMIEQQQQLLKEIEDAIKEIVSGVEYEDEFYKHILDKMVVQDKDNIDVYLNLLPMKWSYTVAKASKKAVASEWNISEASLPAEGHAARQTGGAAPIPGVVIRPHAPAPVQHAEGIRRVEAIGLVSQLHLAPGPHAVDLLVIIEAAGLRKRRADDHGLFRLLRQGDGAVNGLAVQKMLHMKCQLPALGHMAEHQGIAPAGGGGGAGGRALRQTGPAHGKGPHGAFGPLPALVKMQERDGVQAHIPVVVNGQSHGKVVICDEIIVPLLDAGRRGLDIRPAIDGQKPLGIARLPEIAAAVQQGPCGGDLMLHGGTLPFYFLYCTIRRRIFPPGLPFWENFLYTEKNREALHMENEAIQPGRWRHFKGKEYQVLGMARHSETLEQLVVYRALYGEGGLWVRPAAMWLETVDRDGYCGPRFVRIGD